MAVKNPLCLYSGAIRELQPGDTVSGAAGGGAAVLWDANNNIKADPFLSPNLPAATVYNVFMGQYTGSSASGALLNSILIGRYTGSSILSGNANIIMGYLAGSSLTQSIRNIMIGSAAGRVCVSGSGNVMIGHWAGNYELGSDTFYLDGIDRGSLTAGRSGALIYGNFNATPSSQTLRLNAQVTIPYNLTVGGTIYGSSAYAPDVLSGSGPPSSTPTKCGNFYVDTLNSKQYFSNGSSGPSNWVLATPTIIAGSGSVVSGAGSPANPYVIGDGSGILRMGQYISSQGTLNTMSVQAHTAVGISGGTIRNTSIVGGTITGITNLQVESSAYFRDVISIIPTFGSTEGGQLTLWDKNASGSFHLDVPVQSEYLRLFTSNPFTCNFYIGHANTPTYRINVSVDGSMYVGNGLVTNSGVPIADSYIGTTVNITMGNQNAVFGDVVNIKPAGTVRIASALSIGLANGIGVLVANVSAGGTAQILIEGMIHLHTKAPVWWPGYPVYLTANGTAGNTLSQTAPSGAGNIVQIIGIALSDDVLLVRPSFAQVELK